jgi:hypothetical protein
MVFFAPAVFVDFFAPIVATAPCLTELPTLNTTLPADFVGEQPAVKSTFPVCASASPVTINAFPDADPALVLMEILPVQALVEVSTCTVPPHRAELPDLI